MISGRFRFAPSVLLVLSPLLFILMFIGCGSGTGGTTQTAHPTTYNPPYAIINGHLFHLEIAADEATRNHGLSDRSNLPQDSAMVFVFEKQEYLYFWMKETLIPLDILFLDSNRKIVDIQTMQTEPGVPDNQLHIYKSAAPALYAIEMNAGLAAKYEFAVGMVVELNTGN